MGHGNYSHAAHEALLKGRAHVPREQVFKQSRCHPLMDPKGVKARESRDSVDHPNSLPIVFALDVTGSMGKIPEALARHELPHFMKLLTDTGVRDPQLLFMAVGDATCDSASLQVGQFESTAELMDQWLTWSFLEGGGGGQNTESYELALYFLVEHTDTDAWVKRKKRGYLLMTGDELPYPAVSKHQVEALIGDSVDEDIPTEAVVAALQEKFEPFFLIPDLTRRERCERRWRDLLGCRRPGRAHGGRGRGSARVRRAAAPAWARTSPSRRVGARARPVRRQHWPRWCGRSCARSGGQAIG